MAKKMTIEDFERLSKKTQADKEKLSGEISELIRKEAELAGAANEAAAAGDVDGYMSKAKEKERVSATIYVKRTQLDKLAPFADADVVDSWKSYLEDYNKEFEKQLADYSKACEVVRRKFVDLCLLQNAALAKKERFGAFARSSLDNVPMKTIPAESGREVFHARLNFYETPDMRFCRVGCKTAEEDDELVSLFNNVIRLRKPFIK